MNLPLVTHDAKTCFAYIALAERHADIVATSVPLMRTSDDEPALSTASFWTWIVTADYQRTWSEVPMTNGGRTR